MTLAKTGLGAVVECSGGSNTDIVAVENEGKNIYVRGLLIFNTKTTGTQVCEIHVMNNHSGSEQNKTDSNKIGRLTLTPSDTAFFEFPYPLTLTTQHDRIVLSNALGNEEVNVLPIGDKES